MFATDAKYIKGHIINLISSWGVGVLAAGQWGPFKKTKKKPIFLTSHALIFPITLKKCCVFDTILTAAFEFIDNNIITLVNLMWLKA